MNLGRHAIQRCCIVCLFGVFLTCGGGIFLRHIIRFSGGIGSWGAARRVIGRFGVSDVVLLFADTLIEDEDTYRFLSDASSDLGVEITRICEGRDPWGGFPR